MYASQTAPPPMERNSCASPLLCAIRCLQRRKLRQFPARTTRKGPATSSTPPPVVVLMTIIPIRTKAPGVCFPRRFVACNNLSMISNVKKLSGKKANFNTDKPSRVTPVFMGAECCKKSCNKSCKLFLQLLSNELWVHAHYGATKVLCTALLECGGVIFFFFATTRSRHAPSHYTAKHPARACGRGYSFNLHSPHSRYPKASNLVPQRYWVELAPSGWHCCCCCLLLRKVMAGKPNHEHTIPGNLNQPLSR